MHGGVKFYRGAAKAARTYVERDCARYDDYYLAEGDGIAMRFVAEAKGGDGEREVRVEVRDAFAGLMAQGWTDALRKRHPDERIYTFWDYLRKRWERNAGLRIDHLLLSPKVAKRLKRAEVDRHVRGWEKSSDHAPVWIELL